MPTFLEIMKLFNSVFVSVFLLYALNVMSGVGIAGETSTNGVHTVKPGENIYRISLMYGMSQKELLELNNLKDDKVKIGQKLIVKGVPKDVVTDGKTVANDKAKNSANDGVRKADEMNVNDVIGSAKTTTVSQSTFVWPVRGTIVASFNSKVKTGSALGGVKIACERGSAVRATAAGEVVYNDIVDGYGNVILIKHYNGFITAYGYIDPVVVPHDRVKKGQIIAYVSKPNKSERSIVYFSIRKDGKSYDPDKLIQAKISN